MQSNVSSGRHRKPTASRAFAARTAISAGAAVAAVLMAGGSATAVTANTDMITSNAPELGAAGASNVAEPPCTGTPLDAMVGPIIGSTCGAGEPGSPGEEDSGDPGTPPPPASTVPSVAAEDPPAPGGAALPIPCTGYPIDAFTTCGASGHQGNSGGDRGDAAGADTPNLGGQGGGGGSGENPPAG